MRARLVLALAAVVAIAVTLGAAIAVEAAAGDVHAAKPALHPLPALLSRTGLYVEGSTDVVRPENLPFSPQYPLWSDGTRKRRWIHVPPGTSIDATQPDAFAFPPGTKLWKEFSYAGRVETRYMERIADGRWRFATYVWNEDGRDAALAPEDGVDSIAATGAPAGRYAIPSRADCLACHEGAAVPVLGFTALQLSPDRDALAVHADALEAGADLYAFVARGTIRNLPRTMIDTAPRIVAASDVERAALGYLHGNCGHCHNASGAVAGIDLVLAQRAGDAQASAGEVLAALVGRDSRFRSHGGDATSRVVPGDAERSVVAARMRSTNPMTRMPPLGVTVVDDAGLALVERWINQYLNAQPENTR